MAYMNIKRQEMELIKKIGSGGFSSVFKAKCRGHEVAAKRLNDVDRHEVNVLSTLDHPNIVKLIGVVEDDFDMYLILELCNGGSLRSHLDKYKHKGERLSMRQVLDLAQQAAKPIQYLNQMKVVHKDVKSPNYLIADGNVLKLADFGLAKNIAITTKNATDRASHAWMAPELMRDGVLSPKYDIHSYGVVVWEICTTEVPFEGVDHRHIIWRICENNERPLIPSDCPAALADLMRACWHIDWHERPSIDEVLLILSSLISAEEKATKQAQSAVASSPEHAGSSGWVSPTVSRQQAFVAGPWILERKFDLHTKSVLTSGIAVNTTNGDIAVVVEDKVQLYTSQGEYKHNLETTQGLTGSRSRPCNVTVSSKGYYYVTVRTEFVMVYDTSGVYTGKWVAISPDNIPSDADKNSIWGLAIDDKDQLLVGVRSRHSNYISRHRCDGSHIASIKVGIRPDHLAATLQETVVVSDCGHKVVNIVDINTGQLRHTVRPPRSNHWGICSCEDIIYICDMARGIHCFSVLGEYLGHIATGKFPRGVTFVKEDNRLLVSGWSGLSVAEVHVYKRQK